MAITTRVSPHRTEPAVYTAGPSREDRTSTPRVTARGVDTAGALSRADLVVLTHGHLTPPKRVPFRMVTR